MCDKQSKPRKVPSTVVQIDWTDDWSEPLFNSLGAMLIACAQLEYQIYIVAKRKDGRGLLKWISIIQTNGLEGIVAGWSGSTAATRS